MIIINKIKRVSKRSISSLALVGLVGWSMMAGYAIPRVIEAYSVPQAYAMSVGEAKKEALPPILARIAKCESNTGHYRNGQVTLNVNTNGSVDVGKYQINMKVWGKTATDMSLNLMDEGDNETMAKWIYANRGTNDWYSSASCWQVNSIAKK